MSLGLTWREGVDLLLRNRYSLTLIGAIVFLPTDLLVALIEPSRGWGDDVDWGRYALTLLPLVLASAFAYAAAIAAVAVEPEGAREEPRTPFASLADAAARLATLLVMTVVAGLAIAAGFVALVVPGILLLIWWALAYHAVMVEGRGWRAALGRSRDLARGSFWPLLAVLVALGVVAGATDYALWRVGVELFPDVVGAWLAGAVADTVSTALFAAFLTASYWQLNERSTLGDAS